MLFALFNNLFIVLYVFNFMKAKKKRGISAIITILLLVAFVIILTAAILLWNKELFSHMTSDSISCNKVKFTPDDICYEEQNVQNIQTGQIEPKTHLKFNVINEMEDNELEGFLVFFTFKSGNIKMISSLFNTQVKSDETKSLITDFFSIKEEEIDIVRVVPKIIEKHEIQICDEKGVDIQWETVKNC
jgi:flagellin-like protein